MGKEFELTFSEAVKACVSTHYATSSLILEYGSGGSTLLGATYGKTIITTESSAPLARRLDVFLRRKETVRQNHSIAY